MSDADVARAALQAVEYVITKLEKAVIKKINDGDSSWPPLKPATKKAKAKAGKTKMLIWSGDMKNAITHKTFVKGHTIIGEVGIYDPVVLEYAPSHEFGTKNGTIPERSFLRSTMDDMEEELGKDLDEMLGDELEKFWMTKD